VLGEKGIKLITVSTGDAQELRSLVFKGISNLGEDYFTRKTF